MIKHDYKSLNNKTIIKQALDNHVPSWATHPFMVLSMAVLTVMLAILINKDNEFKTEYVEHTGFIELDRVDGEDSEIAPPSHKQPSQTIIDGAEYTGPIDIPLQLDSRSSNAPLKSLASSDKWLKESVRKGDNLSLIFKRIGLSAQMVQQAISLDDNTKKLSHLRPGEIIYYQLDEDNKLIALKYVLDLQNTLFLERTVKSQVKNRQPVYESRIVNKTIELRTAFIYGVITDSLFMSGKRAGLSDTLLVNLANIFDWDIDFILDIRSGDSFSVLYQEKFLDGEKIGNGNIIATEFISRERIYQAVRYRNTKGNSSYYTPSGLNMRKAFLRAPIKFSYISSGFKPRRYHPILKRWKAHRGIDYRAKRGTPIRAAGDGKVTASSRNKYNGKYVFIQHGQGIVTKYLHMSRRAVSRGKRVKQGQIIGYVGATGLAEAPHLHYEFLVNGIHRNPRTVKLPKARPISPTEKPKFLISSRKLIAQLEERKRIQSNGQAAD